MRIALIAHHVAPISAPFIGGVESHTSLLAGWLAEAGHDVTLFAPAGSEVPGVRIEELDLDLNASGISDAARRDVSAMPDTFLAAHHAYLQLMLSLGRSCPFDVVHINTLHYLPVAMAHTLSVRPIITLHCPPTPWLESAVRVAGRTGPLALDFAAVSPALADLWAHAVTDPAIVPNGVDLGRWVAGPGGTDAVWAGRVVPEKAPHLAIDAARRAGLAIRLAGPIIDHAYWAAEVQPRLGPDAVYVGHLTHDELVDLVGSAAVAIQSPEWEEPFGLAAAEAIACGTPVAAFARGGLAEVVGPESGVLARPSDVDSLARALQLARSLDRGRVRADAEARLGVATMGAAYEDLYRCMIRGQLRAATPTDLDVAVA